MDGATGWLSGHGRVAALFALVALVLLLVAFGGTGQLHEAAGDEPSQPTQTPAVANAPPSPSPTAQASRAPSSTATPAVPVATPVAPVATPVASSDPAPIEPATGSPTAIVPVLAFWSPETSISRAELEAALAGERTRYGRVVVPEDDRARIADALGVTLSGTVEMGDPAAIRRAVRQGALGLLRVDDITPAVRALAIDEASLFGNDRLRDLADWPLIVAGSGPLEWDQSASWTLVAGGDIQLDRWMAYHVTVLDKGVDWPWDGGTVAITGRHCCSDLGHRVPLWERTGNEGAVRALFSEADLAMANLEAAAVDDPRYHALGDRFPSSLSFSGDPRLLTGLKNAGFGFLSLANNHIHNAGAAGIRDTRRHLDELDIAFAGAGRDLAQATEGALLEAAGQQIAVLPCTSVGRIARADRHGAAPCSGQTLLRQIREAAATAELVIVFPHWGREYRAVPSAGQRALAQHWVAAGANLVLGAHSHWTGAIEQIGDSLVFYSMGNLAFDQPWSEATMQGVILELTFNADRLVQVRLHPTLIVEHVQPNLLEYDAGGRRVFDRMREASEGLLPY
jgi:poly-gamma-glutamate capsule biosynthesis protein CapA/YwtB (metallophosphatase superfamily)